MPRKHLFIHLTKPQEEELNNFMRRVYSQHPPDLRARHRAQVVLLSHQGRTIQEISRDYDVSTRSIRSWFKAYQRNGINGLTGERKGLSISRKSKTVRFGQASQIKMDYPTILTLPEAADFLRVSERTIYRLSQAGKLPAIKIGGQWRFRKEDIYNHWMKTSAERQQKTIDKMLSKLPNSYPAGADRTK